MADTPLYSQPVPADTSADAMLGRIREQAQPDPPPPQPTQTVQQPDVGQAQTATPVLSGSPGSKDYNNPSKFHTPLIAGLISSLIKPPMQAPAPGELARPVSRAETFENFLGNFLYSFGQGMANAGHGPGSFGRGFGAAMNAPRTLAIENQQLQNQQQLQQSELQQRQAQTQLTQQQLANLPAEQQARLSALTQQPRFDPDTHAYLGTMNDAQYANYIKGQGASNQRALNQKPDPVKALMQRAMDALDKGDRDTYNATLKELTQLQGTRTGEAQQNRLTMFHQTQEYQVWKAKFDAANRLQIAQMTQNKAPAAMMQTAEFSRSGLKMLDEGEQAFNDLRNRGVLGSVPANKLEDWVFGKGLIDPSLSAHDRAQIGKMRAAFTYTSTAAMRAHTGRSSREIYDDFKNTLGVGQSSDALEGAIGETRSMLQEYADSASDANIQAIRGGGTPSGFPRPKAAAAAPTGDTSVSVQIPGQPPGTIPASKLQDFQRKYPSARVIQ